VTQIGSKQPESIDCGVACATEQQHAGRKIDCEDDGGWKETQTEPYGPANHSRASRIQIQTLKLRDERNSVAAEEATGIAIKESPNRLYSACRIVRIAAPHSKPNSVGMQRREQRRTHRYRMLPQIRGPVNNQGNGRGSNNKRTCVIVRREPKEAITIS